jgi:peptidyl-prolyl cis-trans isomerase D
MFDFVANHKRLILIILLVLIVPPFALFGIDSYFTGRDSGQAVARVGDHAISQEEFSRGLRDQQQALQRMTEGRTDPAMLDTPELRQATLEVLIQRRLVLQRALGSGVVVPDEHLKSMIGELPLFRDESGKFSFARYEQYLKSEGMTPVQFETRLRQDLMLQHINNGYGRTAFAPRWAIERIARLSEQQREVSQHVIEPVRFMAQVKPDPGAAKLYYDANVGDFRIPEQVRVEYVTLSMELLAQQIQVDPAEVRKYYEASRSQFGAQESRQVSHILVSVEGGAKEKARAKAEEIYQQLQKNPAGFAEAAKKYSQDTGSAARGGDLGRISRGTMKDTPEFEETAFKLKPGEISPPVETRHGYHIIQLTALQPAQTKPFEEVRAQVEGELRKQLAARRFAELADQFKNVLYEQSDSLKPAADLIKTAPKTSGWISRNHADDPLLNNPRLLAAIFSDEALKSRRNTEEAEVAPGVLVAARVVEHKPAAVQPFEEVRGAIEKRLAFLEAGRLAAAEGRRLLGELKQGKSVQVTWSAPQLVSRMDRKALPDPVTRQAFRMDVSTLPAYAGVETLPGTYYLLRVTRVQEAENIPPERVLAIAEEMRQALAQETLMAYLASLRQKAGVKINKEFLEKKEEGAPAPASTPSDRPAPKRRGVF